MREIASVLENVSVADNIFRLRLLSPGIAHLARPGQFVMIKVSDGLDPLLRRPFSFNKINQEDGSIDIMYRVVGRGTSLLSRYSAGQKLDLIGPLGNGFRLLSNYRGTIAMIAGGMGIAPLYGLTLELRKRIDRGQLHLFYGARSEAELIGDPLLDSLGIQIHLSTEDGSKGYQGTVTNLFFHFVSSHGILPSHLYSCGPLKMQTIIADWARKNDVAAQMCVESLMACGFGACLGCAIPARSSMPRYLHVCKDGPVFDAELIQWESVKCI